MRERQRLIYRHKGFEICRNFFLHLHSIREKKLKNLFKQYKENFAEANAIILPGRTPYAWKSDCKLLPTEYSRHFVYGKFAETVDECEQKKISLRSFLRIWHDLLPFIKKQKPATDLCWYCQQRSIQMQRSVNQPDSLKSLAAQELIIHLDQAAKERSLYNNVCEL